MDGSYTPTIHPPGSHGPHPSWELNYPALTHLMNGQYYADYKGVFGMMGLPVMSEKRWSTVVSWLGGHVEELANSSCSQVHQMIIDRGDKLKWAASFDGFYLTRGHHSNNSSATLHDVATDKIAWFEHRTKRGAGANWSGTSAGAEGDMLGKILKQVKDHQFELSQIIMDHDTAAANIVTGVFPEARITYCGNHTAKTFHRDLVKIKAIQCKVSLYQCHFPCNTCFVVQCHLFSHVQHHTYSNTCSAYQSARQELLITSSSEQRRLYGRLWLVLIS